MCGLASLALGADWLLQGNGSRAVLPLARHQCSTHCESGRVARCASKRSLAPHAARDTAK